MSDLQRFATAVLSSWSTDKGHQPDAPIVVADLLDRVFPYAAARRKLGIDVSEDYEALALRLIAEEGGHATVKPEDAAELARVTMSEKLPDLAVLQLLRGAQISLQMQTLPVSPSAVATPKPIEALPAKDTKWQSPASHSMTTTPATDGAAIACWSCFDVLPSGRSVKFCTHCGADQRPPVCQACHEPLERDWKHCPECGTRVEGRDR